MVLLDWIVLSITLVSIVAYGIYKGRKNKNIESYLLADKAMPWYHVWFSVMATQASAVTFLSAPGLAYNKGMGFVQFYFGLPLAVLVLCYSFIPNFYKLNIYTAYEYLEHRFDSKTRALTSGIFLIQRGLAAGIGLYAPAVALSAVLGWNDRWITVGNFRTQAQQSIRICPAPPEWSEYLSGCCQLRTRDC